MCFSVAYKFGLIGMASGLIGVPLGSALAQKFRGHWQQADPLICAIGLLISAPLLFFAMITANTNSVLCYTLIFFGQLSLNLNWSIVADMLLVSSRNKKTLGKRTVIFHNLHLEFGKFNLITFYYLAVRGNSHKKIYGGGIPDTYCTCFWRCRQSLSHRACMLKY